MKSIYWRLSATIYIPPADIPSKPICMPLLVDVNGFQVDAPVIARVSTETGLPAMVPGFAVILHAVAAMSPVDDVMLLAILTDPAELI